MSASADMQMSQLRRCFVATKILALLLTCSVIVVLNRESASFYNSNIKSVRVRMTADKGQGQKFDPFAWLDDQIPVYDPSEIRFSQNDSRLHNWLRARHIYPPARPEIPYNLEAGRAPEKQTVTAIRNHPLMVMFKKLGFKLNQGVFVEVGAYDGVSASMSLPFEVALNWTGLLIECNPVLVPSVRKINRKAYFADVCLSKTTFAKEEWITSMDAWPASSSFQDDPNVFPSEISSTYTKYLVQTVPLYALIRAVGFQKVDLIILDVQSLEWDVVQNFPFHLIYVKAWIIEVELLTPASRSSLEKKMQEEGYKSFPLGKSDQLFVHSNSLMNKTE